MAQEIISFLEGYSVPNIALLFFLLSYSVSAIFDFKLCRLSDSHYKEEIKELKRENKKLEGVIDSYGRIDN